MSSDPKFCIRLQWQGEELKLWIQDSELHLALAEAWDGIWVLLFLSSSNLQVSTTWPSVRIPEFAHMSLFYSKSLCSAHKNPDLGMWEITYRQIKWLFPPQSQYVVLNRTVSQPLLKSVLFKWQWFIPSNYRNLHLISEDWSSTDKILLNGKSLWLEKKTKLKTKPLKKKHQFHDYTR